MGAIAGADQLQKRLRQINLTLLVMMIGAVLGGVAEANGLLTGSSGLSFFFFRTQDALVVALLFIVFAHIKAQPATGPQAPLLPDWANSRAFWLALVPLALIALCYAGRMLVFENYDLSRDEQLAGFDAYIYAHGRLFWPIPPEWRPNADALNQMFMLPIGNYEAWVSGYLPSAAVLRALVGMVADPTLTNPLLVAVGAMALWQVSGKLLGEDRNARIVTMILYLCSSQVLFMGMTSYAMTSHLAFNLLWLMLFLKDHPAAHAGAMAIGFVATGLHQPLFHPIFVMPFLWMLMRQHRWKLLIVYCTVYGVIGLGWLAWPSWVASHGIGQSQVHGTGGASYIERLEIVRRDFGLKGIYLMSLNLLRFAAWQHLLLIPLMLTGIAAGWRGNAMVRALTGAFILPAAIMLIILPYQGHGWGYRYLHGVIGSACLLAGFGWQALAQNGVSMRRAFGWTTALTLALLPVHAWMIHRFVAPYAQVDRMIAQSSADIAIVDVTAAPFASDLVLNRPDLTNRPIRLGYSPDTPLLLKRLCEESRVQVFGYEQLTEIRHFFGDETDISPDDQQSLAVAVHRDGCKAPLFEPKYRLQSF